MHEPSGDLERLKAALAEQWEHRRRHRPAARPAALQPALRKGKWQVTVALHRDPPIRDTPRDPRRLARLHEGGLYGLAIDLGSTTIAAHLCDLTDGRVLASAG
jgi:uncharacterized 2Fe-2S/4Fe-4S cluster protein (DUF4445 family)